MGTQFGFAFKASVVAGAMSLVLGGCAVGGGGLLSSGIGSNDVPGRSLRTTSSGLDGGGARAPRSVAAAQSTGGEQRMAALTDTKPAAAKDAFKAPAGALADRDYNATRLDIDKARELINGYRKTKGLKALTMNTSLSEAAAAHSKDLAKWDRISHFGSDGSNPWDRVKRTGYKARLAAENVGTGQASIEEVFKGWQDSPGHNKNLLLADAEHMGIALIQDPKTEFKTFWTLVIGSAM